ncbi:hypothetical protein BBJ28_00008236 [Nothophytophthora sp. Chile5]|nr:hypothetical protein BBJ28_00008236 [Nothophytophthora sp. Chile5]
MPRGGRGRGRGRKSRVLSTTKLPRMNNSERGKFYRQKYREYEAQLEHNVQQLNDEVHELQLLLQLRQKLPHQYPRVGLDEVRAATRVAYEGLTRMHERWVPTREEAGASNAQIPQIHEDTRPGERVDTPTWLRPSPSQCEQFIACHQASATPLFFQLESLELTGCSDSRVVVAHGQLYANYSQTTLEALFPAVRHNQHLAARLLAREVVYDCTYRFHTATPFDSTDLVFVSVELDPVAGLQAAISNLDSVEALLGPMIHFDHSSNEAATRERDLSARFTQQRSLPMALDFILS